MTQFVGLPSLLNRVAVAFGCLLVLLTTARLSVSADLPLSRLWTIFPPGGRAGSTVEVTLAGADLDRATQIVFSHSNIAATLHPAAKPAAGDPLTFQVAIGQDVPPGIYDARVVGLFGVSNPRAFAVGAWPELTLIQTNTSLAQAVSVPIGTVVNGHAEPSAVNYFKFTAARGQRVLIECATREIDSRMEPTLFVFDAAGKELDRSRGKGLLDFIPPAEGEYRLNVHDSLFRGGGEYYYRLALHDGPHIDFIFPPAGTPCSRANYVLYGRNLPGAMPANELSVDHKPLQRLEVEIEMPPRSSLRSDLTAGLALRSASAGLDGIEYRLVTTNGTSNPVRITAASAPPALEVEPNNTPDAAQTVPTPCEYEGRFYPAGDKDWITFAARRGDRYGVEVISQRLGFSTAPFVLVQRVHRTDRGEEQISDVQEIYGADTNIGGVEFNTSSRDPIGRFEAKEAGQYRVQIRDLFNSGQIDPGRLYRLVVRKEAPDFLLLALPQPPPQLDNDRREARVWTLLLRRGETLPIKVLAFRRDRLEGEIQVHIEGLPAGVTCGSALIAPNGTSSVLLVTASESATAWTGPVRILGTSRIGSTEITRAASTGSLVWDVNDSSLEPIESRLAAGFYLGVSGDEFAPILLRPQDQTTLEGHPADKLQLPLKLISRAELGGSLKLKAAGFPALDAMKELEISSKTNQVSLELDLAQLKVPVGTYPFYVFAQGPVKYRRPGSEKTEDRSSTAYAGPFTLKVTPAPSATTVAAQTSAR